MVSIRPYKDVINNLAMNHPEWENRSLSASQWKLLEGACETLKHIKDTNKALEGEKEPTINIVLERLFINHELLDNFISDPKNSREKYGFQRKDSIVLFADVPTTWTLLLKDSIWWKLEDLKKPRTT